jgi:hypothetical protein
MKLSRPQLSTANVYNFSEKKQRQEKRNRLPD